jgi:hypothetical protein
MGFFIVSRITPEQEVASCGWMTCHSVGWALPEPSGGARRRESRRRVRLDLERLENRTVPSSFTVINLKDSGAGSLRAAVIAADPAPGSTIDFAAGLHGTITLTSGELDITSSMTITGPGAHKLAVSGNHASRISTSPAAAPPPPSLG